MVDGQYQSNQLMFMNILTKYLAIQSVRFRFVCVFVPQESSGAHIQKLAKFSCNLKSWMFQVLKFDIHEKKGFLSDGLSRYKTVIFTFWSSPKAPNWIVFMM